jgi:S-adenosyl-L-methionine hydrolase (adenosine-forming)
MPRTRPIITLTTDFGVASPYVAAMKGVILTINAAANVIDLSHAIPPQNIRHAAFFLSSAIPYFPADVQHVVVVDPGVGTDRAVLYVEVNGHRLLVPDNGCWNWLAGTPTRAIRLTESRYWRPAISSTFHGRDIFAPAAAHLSLGLDPARLGLAVTNWVRLDIPAARPVMNGWSGEVIFVDTFGNLISNIRLDPAVKPPDILTLGKRTLAKRVRWVRTYGEAKPGELVALISSTGTLEIAVVNGSAMKKLGGAVGTPIGIGWER